jgi:hypothetical protein
MEAVSLPPSAKDESESFHALSVDGDPLKASFGNPSFRMAVSINISKP